MSDAPDAPTDAPDTPTGDPDGGPTFPKWLKWGLLGALAVLIVGYGAIFLYAKVLNDSPDELDEGDLSAALAVDDTTPDEPAEEPAVETDEPAETATTEPPADDADPSSGEWLITDASEFGYRVNEVLFGVDTAAVGRSNQITGSFLIDGTTVTSGEFTVDVASIESDDGRRDGQFRGRIMTVSEFPEAVCTLTSPIDFGVEVAEGAEVTTEATGDLTLRGVTNSVTFELTAQLENGKIGVLGKIPVVFEDYGIDNPSFGGITTEDNGLLEFVLVFEQ
jgi:polyisoprenoid-binding protein YceI